MWWRSFSLPAHIETTLEALGGLMKLLGAVFHWQWAFLCNICISGTSWSSDAVLFHGVAYLSNSFTRSRLCKGGLSLESSKTGCSPANKYRSLPMPSIYQLSILAQLDGFVSPNLIQISSELPVSDSSSWKWRAVNRTYPSMPGVTGLLLWNISPSFERAQINVFRPDTQQSDSSEGMVLPKFLSRLADEIPSVEKWLMAMAAGKCFLVWWCHRLAKREKAVEETAMFQGSLSHSRTYYLQILHLGYISSIDGHSIYMGNGHKSRRFKSDKQHTLVMNNQGLNG